MTDIGLKGAKAAAEAYARKHVTELAQEVIEWQDTALLRDGRMRVLATICAQYTGRYDGLKVAESLVHRASMEIAARKEPT